MGLFNKKEENEMKYVAERDARIELGCLVKCKITGFQGIVVGEFEYLNGCVRLAVASQELKDGNVQERQTFDAEQVEFVGVGIKSPRFACKFELGDIVMDKITKFSGIVVCVAYWLSTHTSMEVQSPTLGKDGAPLKLQNFNSGQCELITSVKVHAQPTGE